MSFGMWESVRPETDPENVGFVNVTLVSLSMLFVKAMALKFECVLPVRSFFVVSIWVKRLYFRALSFVSRSEDEMPVPMLW